MNFLEQLERHGEPMPNYYRNATSLQVEAVITELQKRHGQANRDHDYQRASRCEEEMKYWYGQLEFIHATEDRSVAFLKAQGMLTQNEVREIVSSLPKYYTLPSQNVEVQSFSSSGIQTRKVGYGLNTSRSEKARVNESRRISAYEEAINKENKKNSFDELRRTFVEGDDSALDQMLSMVSLEFPEKWGDGWGSVPPMAVDHTTAALAFLWNDPKMNVTSAMARLFRERKKAIQQVSNKRIPWWVWFAAYFACVVILMAVIIFVL